MKRALQIIVGCIVAATVAATTTATEAVYRYRGADRDSRLLENARKEGAVVLYTSLASTESGMLSEKVVQRAVTEAKAKRFAFDVVETNGPEMEIMARELTVYNSNAESLKRRGAPIDWLPVELVDPVTVLDEQDKWNKLSEGLFIRK